jgi:hypothetical protein
MSLPCSLLTLCAVIIPALEAGAQDWHAEASYTWAENLSRTSYAPDRENGAVYDGSVTAEWHRQLTPNWTMLVNAEAGLEQVPAFPGLDSVHLGPRADLRWKFGLGPFAPVLTFSSAASRYELHEHGRSNWRIESSLSLSKRLTETWRVAASGGYQEDYARDHPFDIRNRRLSLETNWDFAEGWQLSAGGSRLWGELTANANQDIWGQALSGGFGRTVANYYNTVPYEHSTAFETDWIAYRIDCRADIWWASVSFALGANTSLPLRYESVKVVNRAQVSYNSEFWSLSIVHRF